MKSLLLSVNHIMVSSATVYLFIVVALRVFGKKTLAQLSVTDLVFVLLISNAVQNAMVGSDTSLIGGLVAAATLFGVNFIFKYLIYRFPRFQKLVEGEPIIVIYRGKIDENQMRKAQMSFNELYETIREHGCKSVEEVNLLVLETDGNVSVLSSDYKHQSVQHRKRRKKVETAG